MEWRSYYDAELRQPGTRDKIADWLRIAGEEDALSTMIGNRTVFSFPHTDVDYSGPIQARVVAAHRVAIDESVSQQERANPFAYGSAVPGSVGSDRV